MKPATFIRFIDFKKGNHAVMTDVTPLPEKEMEVYIHDSRFSIPLKLNVTYEEYNDLISNAIKTLDGAQMIRGNFEEFLIQKDIEKLVGVK